MIRLQLCLDDVLLREYPLLIEARRADEAGLYLEILEVLHGDGAYEGFGVLPVTVFFVPSMFPAPSATASAIRFV